MIARCAVARSQERRPASSKDLLRQHHIVSLVNVPVLIAGAAWGVLEIDSTSPRDFSQDTIEFLTAAAALIAAFVQPHTAEPGEAARLAAAAVEAQNRDVLLREMQHRVKNSFQLILASIAIQKRRHRQAPRLSPCPLSFDQAASRGYRDRRADG